MIALVKTIKDLFGINKAIAFSTVAKAVQALGSLVTIVLVSKFLTQEEQGYYYTFHSILSIQVFVELGLGGIIIQYVAHEFAFLKIDNRNHVVGEDIHLGKLVALVRFFAKWYLVSAVLLFLILFVSGFSFFYNYSLNDSIEWQMPWLILIIATSLNLLLSPLFAFFEGVNKVKDVAFIRMITQMSSLVCIWTILLCGGKLYTASFTSLLNVIINILLLFKYKGLMSIYKNVITNEVKGEVNYFNEIFPYQWRVAISWMSGYFIFQLFNPVLFATCGAEVAGQMGMTLSVLNGILGLTLSWTSTNMPSWSSMVARKEYNALDVSFNKVLKSSSMVCFIGIMAFLLALYILNYYNIPLYGRFLPFYLSAILSTTIFFNNIINAWATYLRCHKKEPFIIQATIVGVANAFSTLITANFIGVQGVVIGYTSIVIFLSLPLSYVIFKTKKKLYNV